MKQDENDQNFKKESTPVVGKKPNGKSRLKPMAQITLGPNEAFEHIHSDVSYTSLIKGKGALKIGNKVIEMRPGRKIKIPAGVTHTLTNIGARAFVVSCLHPAMRKAKKGLR
jgi:quercetin dioxygenase-like cupin family protein